MQCYKGGIRYSSGTQKWKTDDSSRRRSYKGNMSINTRGDTKVGFKKIELPRGIHVGRTYHCPVCGNKNIVRCGKCRRITCYDGKGHFTCAYCGNSGKVSGTMDSIEAYDNSGMKQDGMKYYPGDKGDKVV